MPLEESIIPEIERLVQKNRDKLDDKLGELRLFIITPNKWLRVYKGHFERYQASAQLSFIRNLRPDRAYILNLFAKLEFITNEFIQARFLGLFSEKAYEFDDLLE